MCDTRDLKMQNHRPPPQNFTVTKLPGESHYSHDWGDLGWKSWHFHSPSADGTKGQDGGIKRKASEFGVRHTCTQALTLVPTSCWSLGKYCDLWGLLLHLYMVKCHQPMLVWIKQDIAIGMWYTACSWLAMNIKVHTYHLHLLILDGSIFWAS